MSLAKKAERDAVDGADLVAGLDTDLLRGGVDGHVGDDHPDLRCDAQGDARLRRRQRLVELERPVLQIPGEPLQVVPPAVVVASNPPRWRPRDGPGAAIYADERVRYLRYLRYQGQNRCPSIRWSDSAGRETGPAASAGVW